MSPITKLLAVMILAAPLSAFSQSQQPAGGGQANQRQATQGQRIDQGIQSGSLTQREATQLQKGQSHVQNMENKAMADGSVSQKERERLRHAQNVQSQKIEHQKHDRQHDRNHDGKTDRPKQGGNGR